MTILDRKIPRRPGSKIFTGPGLTEQSHRDQCDVNIILKQYQATGLIRHSTNNAGRYDDVTGADFQKSMDTIARTKSLFESLPSSVRKEFNHDPAKFLDYCQNPANRLDLEKRGILSGLDGKPYTPSPEVISNVPTEPTT